MKTGQRLKIAGKELIRGNFGNAFKSFMPDPIRIESSSYNRNGGMYLFDAQGNAVTHFAYANINSALKAYAQCSPLTAVINRKTQAFINGKTTIVNTAGKAKGKEATGDIATKVRSLLKKPNPLQNQRSFEAQHYSYLQISGYNVVLPIKPVGFKNVDAVRLWNIPPYMLNIIENPNVNIQTAKTVKDFIQLVQLTWGGLTVNLNLDDIFIFKDFTISSSSYVIPESRIVSLQDPINNIIGAYRSRNVLINRRGAMGILSNAGKDQVGDIPLDPTEKETVQNELKRYGLRHDQWQVIVTSANLQWQQMGYPTKELMLFEEIDDDVKRICDTYNYPYRLLSSNTSNSLSGSDISEFKKLLYQDAIIPEAESISESWNELFDLEQFNIQIQKDYKHIPALQDDQVNEATARYRRNQGLLIEFQNNLITLNQWREANNDEPVSGELGDLYYYELVAKGIAFAQGVSGQSTPDTSGISGADSGQAGNNQSNNNQNNGGNNG